MVAVTPPDNNFLNPSIIAKALLACLQNELVMSNSKIVTHAYEEEFHKKVNGYEVGDTIDVERPSQFYTQKGRINSDAQAIKPGKAQIKVDQQASVKWGFTSADMTMKIQPYAEKYLKSAASSLAQTLDTDLMSMVDDIYNVVGTPGEVPNSFDKISPFAQRMDDTAVPNNNRSLILSPNTMYKVAGDQTRLFNSTMNSGAYKAAEIGNVAGLNTYKTQNTPLHYTGDWTGVPLINGANQNQTWDQVKNADYQTVNVDGLTATKTVKRGDVFTIAGVFALNPVPGQIVNGVVQKKQLPYLQQFTVKEDVIVGAGGVAALKVRPFIITDGAQRTVSAAPADNAVITFFGAVNSAYDQDFSLSKGAFTIAVVPLILPQGAAWKARASAEGLSVRITKQFDQETDIEMIRADMLYGFKCLRPEFAVRSFGLKVA